MCGFFAFSFTANTAAAPNRTQLQEWVSEGGEGREELGGRGWESSAHMPRTTLMKAWLVELEVVRPDDMTVMERGRRSIVATDMKAGWYENRLSSAWRVG